MKRENLATAAAGVIIVGGVLVSSLIWCKISAMVGDVVGAGVGYAANMVYNKIANK